MKSLWSWLDAATERRSRTLAQTTSRRSLLVGVGRTIVAAAFTLPVLPFDRTSQAHAAGHGGAGAPKKGPATATDCDYWRYCSVDGFLCSCCGGSSTTCPPGTTASKVSWVGTCHNPADGKDYLVSYNDCCGRTSCGQCFCNTNHGDRPGYRLGVHNDVNWCMANDSSVYHCTVSVIVGVAEKE
ncbi:methylamine dehydrogenase light chain [Variovorax sp. J22R133]|uniref:methylamine dehydrogenase light chain n=1 Tax=Variovorax brevis TaxID=3053503 RepID=UPI00257762D7|nr:methylamine dehydrogenase light chain [Variovorax sp. J22R133]MDM0111443.1 methylamine dehydrogenase light chain [Variovorax sp. J22R133]